MKCIKTIISVVACAGLILSAFTGCTNNADEFVDAVASRAATVAEAEAEARANAEAAKNAEAAANAVAAANAAGAAVIAEDAVAKANAEAAANITAAYDAANGDEEKRNIEWAKNAQAAYEAAHSQEEAENREAAANITAAYDAANGATANANAEAAKNAIAAADAVAAADAEAAANIAGTAEIAQNLIAAENAAAAADAVAAANAVAAYDAAHGAEAVANATAAYDAAHGAEAVANTEAAANATAAYDAAHGAEAAANAEARRNREAFLNQYPEDSFIRYAEGFAVGVTDTIAVYNVEDLNALAAYVNAGHSLAGKTIVQKADIAFNESVLGADWAAPTEASPAEPNADLKLFAGIGNKSYPFSGTYDGQGYEIKGVYIYGTVSMIGFFGRTKDATIKNVIIKDACVVAQSTDDSNDDRLGGLIGDVKDGTRTTVQNCVFVGTVGSAEADARRQVEYAGRLAGRLEAKATASNCVFVANVIPTKNSSDDGIVVGKGVANLTKDETVKGYTSAQYAESKDAIDAEIAAVVTAAQAGRE